MKKSRKILIFTILALLLSVSVHADELTDTLDLYSAAFDAIWLIICGGLVFFMQAGFAMVETGLTRAKNAGNIIMKNLMDFSAGAILYWAVGWGLMYGESAGGFIGTSDFFLASGDSLGWFFQVVFAATAATIVSGAMAERTKFSSYLIYSVVISGLIYPISGHWIWNGGWLSAMGFHDFAGSTVVHSVGAWAALMGAIIIGPRVGKYVKINGKVNVKAIMGHNMPLAALGVFILWFGWYGFNAGSTLSGTDPSSMAAVAVTTTLAAAAGSIAAMFTTWIAFGKPDVSMSLNGALAGLVGITAGCWVVGPGAAIIIGLIAGILVVASVELFDKVLHIDDPVGAVSVHGVCGVWGTLAVGIFGDIEMIGSGLSRAGQIGVQALGAAAVFVWVSVTAGLLFLVLKKTIGLRVSEEEELRGLDIEEHGTESYAGFQIFQNM
ncbi:MULTISPECIES: ammonium transporter [unclassified Oceanispirochaeta]|uniref:ammonium transporter n=1 Tax=unclassified Oceanispirochaeta TaxID=2635722 RepID=UPI000E096791|nr:MULTISPECIES: ammonium transporter [unclassified Oceanispirochaeta]MBF9014887.1 ammonium transporter [Oceanispirochaeta sp. M2]NPD71432.1 ammonium transporter [Oceanispirochaeta sp. M1]RDG33393.1 ammonium transporter [Oceanispirochaeta sp. M1]